MDPEHDFITAESVCLDPSIRRAASRFAQAEGLDVVELVPFDLPLEHALDLLRYIDPHTFRREPLARHVGSGHALLATRDVLSRAEIAVHADLDPVAFLRTTSRLKHFAASSTDLAVAAFSASSRYYAKRYAWLQEAFLREMLIDAAPLIVMVELAECGLLITGLLSGSVWGLAALAAYHVQPLLVFSGSPLRPRDLAWRPFIGAGEVARLPSSQARPVHARGMRELRTYLSKSAPYLGRARVLLQGFLGRSVRWIDRGRAGSGQARLPSARRDAAGIRRAQALARRRRRPRTLRLVRTRGLAARALRRARPERQHRASRAPALDRHGTSWLVSRAGTVARGSIRRREHAPLPGAHARSTGGARRGRPRASGRWTPVDRGSRSGIRARPSAGSLVGSVGTAAASAFRVRGQPGALAVGPALRPPRVCGASSRSSPSRRCSLSPQSPTQCRRHCCGARSAATRIDCSPGASTTR